MSIFLLILLIAALGGGYSYYKNYRCHYWMTRCLSNINVLLDVHCISLSQTDLVHLKENIIDDMNRMIAIVKEEEFFSDVQEYAIEYIEKTRNRYISLINLRIKHGIDATV